MSKGALTCVLQIILSIVILCSNIRGQTSNRGRINKLTDKCTIHEQIHEDIAAQVSKFRVVFLPSNTLIHLDKNELKLLRKLVEASQYLEDIYWRQSDPKALDLYKRVEGCNQKNTKDIRRLLMINGSRYDLLRENEPFVGEDRLFPGRELYPAGITGQEIREYIDGHPEKKAELYNPFTVVKRQGNDLIGVPYHVEYKFWLERAAIALQEAATLSPDKAFAHFLRLRANALLTDDYYESDLAWLDLENPKFDVIFAPYETYLDDLLGVKTSYGAAVMIRVESESAEMAAFIKNVPKIQDSLPLAPEDRPSKKGPMTPMEVMDTLFRAGDLRHGYQAVADNLPNDARIHQEKGTKKIFFKPFMDARVNFIVLPIANMLMRKDQADLVSMDGYRAVVLMHEIAHGLGPSYARTSSGQNDIRESIGPVFSGLEEAKADIVGLFGLNWLMEKGVLPKERAPEYYASYVAGIFRTIRFGVAEAHGRAEMMAFNYLTEQGAIGRDPQTGRYVIDYAKMPGAVASLARVLLEIEATGDRARAEAWFEKYEDMPPQLKSALANIRRIPVDIDPIQVYQDQPK